MVQNGAQLSHMDPLLTVQDVADRLSVDPKTVRRWAWSGELPFVKLSSKAIRFTPDAVDAFIAERASA